MTVAEAAIRLGVSRQRVHELIEQGRIRARNDSHPSYRRKVLHAEDVEAQAKERGR